MPRRPELVSPSRSAGPGRQRRAQASTASRNGYLRPLARLGTCMAPRVMGRGAATATASQRWGSAGAARRRMRRRGQRAATRRALVRGRARSAVVSWWASPARASARASARLGAVARNSESTTTSACQRVSWRARLPARRPPPARMFHATMRIAQSGPPPADGAIAQQAAAGDHGNQDQRPGGGFEEPYPPECDAEAEARHRSERFVLADQIGHGRAQPVVGGDDGAARRAGQKIAIPELAERLDL